MDTIFKDAELKSDGGVQSSPYFEPSQVIGTSVGSIAATPTYPIETVVIGVLVGAIVGYLAARAR